MNAQSNDGEEGEDQDDVSFSSSPDDLSISDLENMTYDDDGEERMIRRTETVHQQVIDGHTHTQIIIEEEDVLESFRKKWRRELISANMLDKIKTDSVSNNPVETIEERARRLFLKGAECERQRKMYDAIRFYKNAVKLVPDIELQIFESMKSLNIQENSTKQEVEKQKTSKGGEEDEENYSEEGALFKKLKPIVDSGGYVCTKEVDSEATHISDLPYEIISYIIRWIISGDHDFASLGSLSAVCRGFYVAARDEEMFKLACLNVWGMNCSLEINGFNNWKQMYTTKPRLRFEGCYISKTSYMRHGENAFQDQTYRPWYLIKYYRFLRFFPEGLVLMLTSAEEPITCVPYLKSRSKRTPGVLSGHYHIFGDNVVINIEKIHQSKQSQQSNTRFRSRRREVPEKTESSHLEFKIVNHRNRAFSSLVWCRYTIFTRYAGGRETSTHFDMAKNRFPSFYFSGVRSYNAETESLHQ